VPRRRTARSATHASPCERAVGASAPRDARRRPRHTAGERRGRNIGVDGQHRRRCEICGHVPANIGVDGRAANIGVDGRADKIGVDGRAANIGVDARCAGTSRTNIGVDGRAANIGVDGRAANIGVDARCAGTSRTNIGVDGYSRRRVSCWLIRSF
jgi:hypothetical protein